VSCPRFRELTVPTARLTVLQLLQSAGILLVVQIEGELHKEMNGELQKSY